MRRREVLFIWNTFRLEPEEDEFINKFRDRPHRLCSYANQYTSDIWGFFSAAPPKREEEKKTAFELDGKSFVPSGARRLLVTTLGEEILAGC